MSVSTRKPETLSKNSPITATSSPNSVPTSNHHRLRDQALLLMLADLKKYNNERRKQRSLTTIPSTSSGQRESVIPIPPRGTERYCTWRCKSWKSNRFESACEYECGFEHEIVHPSEWKGTPAEAEWDYGVKNGGWRYRQRKVRFADPVVTDVLEGVEQRGREADREGGWEWVEKEDGGIGGAGLGIEMGDGGEDPDEEMEDVFEYLRLK